jgi:NADH:ubiquinone oxidoreductase subunit
MGLRFFYESEEERSKLAAGQSLLWRPYSAPQGGRCAAHGDHRMLTWLAQIFTWWNGQTLNTRFHTWRHGELVGQDEFGHSYYQTRGGKIDPALGYVRRWVIFQGQSEGSAVPPGWYGWLHYTVDTPPTAETYRAREWEMPHKPNMTGTAEAYRPAGSTLASGVRPPATGDYQAWKPGN